jgi:capsular polysaccharide biosynthesis protein
MVNLLTNPLEISVADNAIAAPFKYDPATTKISGCLYDLNGDRILSSQRVSGVGGDRIVNADPDKVAYDDVLQEIAGTSVYLGHLMGHYGHFITETLSTFWALPLLRFDRVAFHPFIFGGLIKPFMKPFLETFGISDDKILVIREYTRFEKVFIPERLFKLNLSVHPQYAECARRVANYITGDDGGESSNKIFLSRSRLEESNRTIKNDKEVDELMDSLGFLVIHPQEMPVVEQISLYKKTRIMTGFSGSALHNCIFMEPQSLLIEIGDPRSPEMPLATQRLCNLSAGMRSSHVRYRATSTQHRSHIDLDYLKHTIQNLVQSQ